jgi:hypothetical protein
MGFAVHASQLRITMASVEEIDQEWDAQIDSDSAAGKIDFLFEEADSEGKAGTLRDSPPSI